MDGLTVACGEEQTLCLSFMVMSMKPPNRAPVGLEECRIFITSIEIQLVESLFSLSEKCSSGDFLESE